MCAGQVDMNAVDAEIRIRRMASPIGELLLATFVDRLCLVDFARRKGRFRPLERLKKRLRAHVCDDEGESPILDAACRQVEEYFAGDRKVFDLPLLFAGTPFQEEVWRLLLEIPHGRTVSYGELAERLGRPRAARAVASANAANAISIIVPCHRVTAGGGGLGGYAGGTEAKRFLLGLEGAPPTS